MFQARTSVSENDFKVLVINTNKGYQNVFMRCPTLEELPSPTTDKTGWPWTEKSPQLSDTMPDGSPRSKISIVTPSLNQGHFIEETIRSVILQGYPDLEYIIIDGGSNDGSVEIIKKYEKWLTYWVSESDRGQGHAINKGFNLSKGEIVAWINSDDIYLQDSFEKITRFFVENQQIHMVYGDCYLIDENSKNIGELDVLGDYSLKRLIESEDYIAQPSVFFRRKVLKKVGSVNESLKYSMDYDLWIRIGLHFQVKKISAYLSCFRSQPQQKTFHTNPVQYSENIRIRAKYGGIKQKYQYIRHLIAERVVRSGLKNEKAGKGN